MEYTVYTRTGKTFTVTSDLTDTEAQEVLRKAPARDDFAHSLASKSKLSPKMRAWLHVKAQWILNPREQEDHGSLPNILAMLTHARDVGGKKRPGLKLHTREGQTIAVKLSDRTGKVNVSDGRYPGAWFGAIQPDGAWRPSRDIPQDVTFVVSALEMDPAGVAAQYGRETGACCFCGLTLSDERSVSVGYGPVCAQNHKLPWG